MALIILLPYDGGRTQAAGVLARAALQYPVEFTVSVNRQVARSLGLTLDEATLSKQLHQTEHAP